jgi:hypothetical protein
MQVIPLIWKMCILIFFLLSCATGIINNAVSFTKIVATAQYTLEWAWIANNGSTPPMFPPRNTSTTTATPRMSCTSSAPF